MLPIGAVPPFPGNLPLMPILPLMSALPLTPTLPRIPVITLVLTPLLEYPG